MLVDQNFHAPRMPVAVVAIGDSGEALLIRSVLESLGAVVSLHLIGTPEDFLKVIGQCDAAAPFMIISAHGDENGLVFGDYVADIDTSMLRKGSMPPAALTGCVNLRGKVVVSTACASGAPAWGEAFLSGGAAAYIAPDDYPEGADAALFVHLLFHQMIERKIAPAEALARVKAYDEAFGMFRLMATDPV